MEDNDNILGVAASLTEELTGANLPRSVATLYSQHTLLEAKQEGLSSWDDSFAASRLRDAERLIQSAFVQKESTSSESDKWEKALVRAAEILEWLDHHEIETGDTPVDLIAAACYQVAGYSARATGLINSRDRNYSSSKLSLESKVIRSFLKCDFQVLFESLLTYWAEERGLEEEAEDFDPWKAVFGEATRSLGVICSYLRWGSEERLKESVKKLEDVARAQLHRGNTYSWLLAKLIFETGKTYRKDAVRASLDQLKGDLTETGAEALERYIRHNYRTGKAVAWPSQQQGFNKLASNQSFALCTPTGSGKTTVAEVALLQGLFENEATINDDDTQPLALYLVPSRALAAEVEAELDEVLGSLSVEPLTVTGLYGGIDWGPSDELISKSERTILICTYEKAEALMRFLGARFVDRISLVVMDEAHKIEETGTDEQLINGSSRAYTFESITSRILSHISKECRTVALSAVADNIKDILASWVSGDEDAESVSVKYQSTRQLIGRLQCNKDGSYRIEYDLLDGSKIDLGEGVDPFVPRPFPNIPEVPNEYSEGGVRKQLRAPALWAAMNIAASGEGGKNNSVFIFIPENINYYSKTFYELLYREWDDSIKPNYFEYPSDPKKIEIWERCLDICEDYFSKDSREYNLLKEGIVIHHGKMPGRMARVLIEVLREGIVNIVAATSTLAEGINLPFQTVLFPRLSRYYGDVTPSEFANIAGRAGRPGSGTEGKCLVLTHGDRPKYHDDNFKWSASKHIDRYRSIVKSIYKGETGGVVAESPLNRVIEIAYDKWNNISNSEDRDEFIEWLEKAIPADYVEEEEIHREGDRDDLMKAVDLLDHHIISTIVENEDILDDKIDQTEMEKRIREAWRSTYSSYASDNEGGAKKEEVFTRRALSVEETVYPKENERRKMYKSSLSPSRAREAINIKGDFVDYIEEGRVYHSWDMEERIDFIEGIVDIISSVDAFSIEEFESNYDYMPSWNEAMRWWLSVGSDKYKEPNPKRVQKWYSLVDQALRFKVSWGVGSIISLIAEDELDSGGQYGVEDWEALGIPWIAFWLKDLFTWGSHEPVVAALLSRKRVNTRGNGLTYVDQYYRHADHNSFQEPLNPDRIGDWIQQQFYAPSVGGNNDLSNLGPVELKCDPSEASTDTWRVLPIDHNGALCWYDPAGYLLAVSEEPGSWKKEYASKYDFTLDLRDQSIDHEPYLEYEE